MSSPTFVPQSFTPQRQAFGRVRDIAWKPLGTNRYAALAARIQHHQAVAIREAIIRRHGSIAEFVRRSGGHVTKQFGHMLTGSAVMQPRELAYAIAHFGEDLVMPDPSAIVAEALADEDDEDE